jgi:hypothetical protein
MKHIATHLITVLLCAVTISAFAESTATPTAEQLLLIMKETAGPPPSEFIPELKGIAGETVAATARGKSVLEWAESALQEKAIPETTYTLYREFARNGERNGYQTPYYAKRTRLTKEVLRWWLTGKTDRLDRINDLIWSICEETTWVVPAHEKGHDFIDLFASETGADLAHIAVLMGDALPEEIQARIRGEIKRRIIEPYLAGGKDYGWGRGLNNWTGVCAGSVGQTLLLIEPDVERQARGLATVLAQLDRFIQNAFAEDGGCLEGMGYWNYGLLHYTEFAEMMRTRTQGRIDLLANPKLSQIAKYPLAVSLGGRTFASFSDGSETSSVTSYLAVTIGNRTKTPELLSLAAESTRWTCGTTFRELAVWNGEKPAAVPLSDTYLPKSGLARLVARQSGRQMVLAVKGGFNNEPHNHNDIGSFIVAVDEEVFLCDPGAGLYNRDYFSSARYKNIFANSYGHSVPRIGDNLQATGKEFRGVMEKKGKKSVSIDFGKAYKVDELTGAVRNVSLSSRDMRLRDSFTFKEPGMPVEEAFVTWKPVEIDGNTARIKGDKATVELIADNGQFTAEKLEDACKANRKPGVLTRITATYPAAAEIEAGFRVRIVQ